MYAICYHFFIPLVPLVSFIICIAAYYGKRFHTRVSLCHFNISCDQNLFLLKKKNVLLKSFQDKSLKIKVIINSKNVD